MGDDKGKWSNVIVGPWPTSEKLQNSKPLKGGKTREEIVAEEMDIIEGLSESIMINLIHTLKENDVKIMDKDENRDIAFIIEVLKYMFLTELS